uniref:IPT/TIG domain-containing protein n=1 Tax=Arcella intermedia TaxID=1963864 RepID=A0A6B2KX84_9EUKA
MPMPMPMPVPVPVSVPHDSHFAMKNSANFHVPHHDMMLPPPQLPAIENVFRLPRSNANFEDLHRAPARGQGGRSDEFVNADTGSLSLLDPARDRPISTDLRFIPQPSYHPQTNQEFLSPKFSPQPKPSAHVTHSNTNDQYRLSIKGVPDKSRVETQIKICLRLEEPSGATTRNWSLVEIDPILVAPVGLRRKTSTQQKPLRGAPSLYLKAEVVAATSKNVVHRCYGCIQRELRNAEKKVKKRKTTVESLEQDVSIDEEKFRILQFYCDPTLNFSTGEVILPTRITCYCRHHKEANGFIINLSLYHQQNLIASGSSPVIMITDDHKATKKRARTDSENGDEVSKVPCKNSQFIIPYTSNSMKTNNFSISKYKLPNLNSKESPASQQEQPKPKQSPTPQMLPPIQLQLTPVTPPVKQFPSKNPDPALTLASINAERARCDLSKFPPNSTVTPPVIPQVTGPDIVNFLAPILPVSVQNQPNNRINQRIPEYEEETEQEYPQIMQVIPNQGPMSGGIDVTVLGCGFHTKLKSFFGNNEATTKTFWGESTFVVTLPPSLVPGPVVVSLQDVNHDQPYLNSTTVLFTYVNNVDRQLLELALQVIGMKLNGRLDNPENIALQIVNQNDANSPFNNPVNYDQSGKKCDMMDPSLITNTIKYLLTLETEFPLDLSLQTSSGHQLLHLAVIMDLQPVIDILLENHNFLSVDLPDSNGWTALHFAAYYNRRKSIKKLIKHGASVFADTLDGKLPHELTRDIKTKTLLIVNEIETDSEVIEKEEVKVKKHKGVEERQEMLLEMDEEELYSKSGKSVNISMEEQQENLNDSGGKLHNMASYALTFLWSLLVKFWWNYRVFIYIGLLAAAGAWTLLDYVPSFFGMAPSPVVVYPQGASRLYSPCNPPRPTCGDSYVSPEIPTTHNPDVVARSFKLSALPSLETYLLNFGQFSTFILSLMLITYHFKKRLRPFRFWIVMSLIFIAFLVGCLFLFDIV